MSWGFWRKLMNSYILKRPMMKVIQSKNDEEWKELRRSFVGGSDVAAIMGCSVWATEFTVWCEKLGVSAKKDTAAMKYGRDNEKRILSYAQDILGIESQIYKSPVTYVKGNRGANLDGIAVVNGEEIGIEIKTTGDLSPWNYVPVVYYFQIQHYMSVCGLKRFLLIAEGRNWREHYFVNSDECPQNEISRAIDDFWVFVEKKEPPYMPDFAKKIERDYAVAAAEKGILDFKVSESNLEQYCKYYIDAKKSLKQVEEISDCLKTKILSAIGQGREMCLPAFLVKANKIESERFDSAQFKEDYPDLYFRYLKKSSYTQLSVKEK